MACALLRARAHHHRRLHHQAAGTVAPRVLAGGLYLAAQSVSITSAADATIRYTSDGTARLRSGTATPAPSKSQDVTLSDRLRHGQARQRRTTPLHHPAARRRTGVRPGAGRVHRRAARHADVRDAGRDVPLHHRRPESGVRRQSRATTAPSRSAIRSRSRPWPARPASPTARSPAVVTTSRCRREPSVWQQRRHQQSRGESADLRRRAPPARTRTAMR